MNRKYIFAALISISFLLIYACISFGNPFVGSWSSGEFNLEFNSDKTFELSIGNALSVNLEGTYKYDKERLTLTIDGHSDLVFSYEFKDGDKTLVLKPESDSGYINTKIEFSRK